jgi:hypothetical protein
VAIPPTRAAGRVDITDGVRKFGLYRTSTQGQDTSYVIDERGEESLLSRESLERILMDLMS